MTALILTLVITWVLYVLWKKYDPTRPLNQKEQLILADLKGLLKPMCSDHAKEKADELNKLAGFAKLLKDKESEYVFRKAENVYLNYWNLLQRNGE